MNVIRIIKDDSSSLNGIYKDIADNLGIETAIKIHEQYKGLQITFPVKLYSPDFLKNEIINEYDGSNIRLLAKKYGYSERWIR